MPSPGRSARELVPLLLTTVPAGPDEAALLETLAGWDHRYTLDAVAPAIFTVWLALLNERVIADEFGAAAWKGTALQQVGYRTAARALSGEKPAWCDDRTTPEVEDCARILAETLSATHDRLAEARGPDPEEWRWQAVGRFAVPHLPLAGLPVVGARFSRVTPIPGGPEAIFNNHVLPTVSSTLARTLSIVSFQAVYDLSDLADSRFISYGGASGHFGSPWYDNLNPLWLRGERIRHSAESLVPLETLTLTPR